jgi:hypothetical protein
VGEQADESDGEQFASRQVGPSARESGDGDPGDGEHRHDRRAERTVLDERYAHQAGQHGQGDELSARQRASRAGQSDSPAGRAWSGPLAARTGFERPTGRAGAPGERQRGRDGHHERVGNRAVDHPRGPPERLRDGPDVDHLGLGRPEEGVGHVHVGDRGERPCCDAQRQRALAVVPERERRWRDEGERQHGVADHHE